MDIPDAAQDATPIERADVRVAQAAACAREHPLVRAGGKLSELADQPPLIAISAATLAAGLLLRRPRLARAGARMLASHLLATAAKTVIKNRVDRTRPNLLVEEGRYEMASGETPGKEMRSFPSGHTAGIVAVTRALTRDYPESSLPGALVSVAVAAVQVPRCAHYPSDLAAGALIGVAAEAAVDRAARLLPP
ncbi:phosphatase PAP2 family protein [Sphingomonas jatrophae]|uniref:PAP2 superfamily protein n=1 Tax=Sphingomonas jatrophae TaxID=1166337 RepID=A0A1I6JKF9_9SPHN|nr:phosphatase PAP2 family protein [Sphingomonas jatrophae]SFR79409.1 PAP2 superfamily protein [Sphingomonas jatrophae]